MNTLIIPDGNRRWARSNGLEVDDGYRAGTEALADTCEALYEQGQEELWVVICTANNLRRPPEQVSSYLQRFLEVQDYTDLPLGFTASPGVELLPDEYRKKYEEAALPRSGSEFIVNYMLGWSLDDEFERLVNINRGAEEPVTREALVSQSAITKPIDLIVRTGGVSRLSAMMPWHSPYAEIYFSDKMWPDFTKEDMLMASGHFALQERRMGQGS